MADHKICWVLFCILLVGMKRISCEDTETEDESNEESDTGMDSQGIYDFMISTKALMTIDFHGSDLIIYEHPNNNPGDKIHPDNRFFVMPLVEIVAMSLNVRYSWLTDAYILEFPLIFWTDELKNAAIEDLERLYVEQGDTEGLTMNQIQMIPMEEVRLIWNSEVPLPDGIRLSCDWIPFSRNPHRLHFSFMCATEHTCKRLKREMEQHPNEFEKLNLEFTTTVKSSASKVIRITGSTLTTSKTFRDLQANDKFPAGEEGIRYMTAEDLQTLSVEVTENYVATTITDAEYVPTQQSLSIAELIYNRLASTKVSTSTMSERAWNSLKWEPDFARPDIVTSQLNDITDVETAQNGTKYLMIDETAFDNADHNYAYAYEFDKMQTSRTNAGASQASSSGCDSSSTSGSVGGSAKAFFFIKASWQADFNQKQSSCSSLFNAKSSRSASSFNGENSNTDVMKTDVKTAGLNNWKVSGEDFNNYMRDQSSYIEFDGEKFTHKPMDLYKMTMSDLTENVDIATTDMQVQKMQKIYHIKVSISNEITSVYPTELDKIKESIKHLRGNLTQRDGELKKELEGQLGILMGAMHMNLSCINDNIEDLQKDVHEHAENFRRLGPGDVSFIARFTSDREHSADKIIKFDTTDINVNNCYNTSTGKFTAPTNGLYLFYFNFKIYYSASNTWVKTYVDDTVVLYTNDYVDKSNPSATFQLQLNQGQVVYLNIDLTRYIAYSYSRFGGHLIKTL